MGQLRTELYDSLSNHHRRRLLLELLTESPRTASISRVDDETERLEFHHVHLPKLDDYGFIEWHRSLCCIERGPRFDDARPILEQVAADTDRFSTCN
ncbi:transcriptional regulator [Natronolimnohabitans sp. A-GB9]|uniref:transcriptional regulator n=1 Tax=Natronolimnohabitans sp. A-GB9 TaxID=3069757 RepID=UPI0027B53802|nr:transcriptional regulator [Natronolimnohabitans sp. A-GB9]MDQ2048974.1 transcriptional regulator [Natronolimnohabitans sp. A-GB9]